MIVFASILLIWVGIINFAAIAKAKTRKDLVTVVFFTAPILMFLMLYLLITLEV